LIFSAKLVHTIQTWSSSIQITQQLGIGYNILESERSSSISCLWFTQQLGIGGNGLESEDK